MSSRKGAAFLPVRLLLLVNVPAGRPSTFCLRGHAAFSIPGDIQTPKTESQPSLQVQEAPLRCLWPQPVDHQAACPALDYRGPGQLLRHRSVLSPQEPAITEVTCTAAHNPVIHMHCCREACFAGNQLSHAACLKLACMHHRYMLERS